jgi:pSer/pThr/pTyr-binding forkhead associated (FHA) protein
MGRKIWQGALAGVIAAIVAWCVSLPFLPYKPVSIGLGGLGSTGDIESQFTLGTFYGWFSNGLFGVLAGLLIALVYGLGRSPAERTRSVLISALAGGLLVAGADACSDAIGIRMLRAAGSGPALIENLQIEFLWAFLLSVALCSAVLLGMTLRVEMILRFFVAVGIATVASLILLQGTSVFASVAIAPMLMSSKTTVNSWALSAPGFLASQIAMGASVGACLAFAERLTRPAWLHLSLAYGEGYTWSIDYEVMRIGHAEGVEIRVQEMQGLAPIHAQIQRYEGDFAVQDLGGGVRHNGLPVGSAWLADNDRLCMGPYEFIFHLRRPVRRRDRDLAPMLVEERPSASASGPPSSARKPEPEGIRFEDDFGNKYPLAQKTTIVGRDADCEISLNWDATVSRRHAEIVLGPNGAMIRDLGSSNGTRLNGTVIQSVKVPLKEGDEVEFGKARLTFKE